MIRDETLPPAPGMIDVVLPWPSSVNRALGAGRIRQRIEIAQAKRRYEQECTAATREQLGLAFWAWVLAKHHRAQCACALILSPPDRRKRDLDNHAKWIIDGIAAASLVNDDAQIIELHLYSAPPAKGGRVRAFLAPTEKRTHDQTTAHIRARLDRLGL